MQFEHCISNIEIKSGIARSDRCLSQLNNSDATTDLKCLTQLNYAAHFGDLKMVI